MCAKLVEPEQRYSIRLVQLQSWPTVQKKQIKNVYFTAKTYRCPTVNNTFFLIIIKYAFQTRRFSKIKTTIAVQNVLDLDVTLCVVVGGSVGKDVHRLRRPPPRRREID